MLGCAGNYKVDLAEGWPKEESERRHLTRAWGRVEFWWEAVLCKDMLGGGNSISRGTEGGQKHSEFGEAVSASQGRKEERARQEEWTRDTTEKTWVLVLVLPLNSWWTLGNSLKLTETQFLHLKNVDNSPALLYLSHRAAVSIKWGREYQRFSKLKQHIHVRKYKDRGKG